MLRSVHRLEGFDIVAVDGRIGHVDEMYFDDQYWTVRYFVVDTAGWQLGRKVLISPWSVKHVDWERRHVALTITREQVERSPDIDTDKPVSRQHEAEYFRHYGYPNYWRTWGVWGGAAYPFPAEPAASDVPSPPEQGAETDDVHLRSSREVIGYHLQAVDDELGHVDDLLLDDETWAIRYLVVDTSRWWFGKTVLVAIDWVREVNWERSRVAVDVTRESIKTAPEWDGRLPLTREWEAALRAHLDREPQQARKAEAGAGRHADDDGSRSDART